jgi:multidrug transporter EmrE-like cation transporter
MSEQFAFFSESHYAVGGRLLNPYLMIFLGAVSNLFAVYFMKNAAGMSKPWPTYGMVVSILLTQWLVSQAMQAGVKVSLAMTAVVVTVMVGSALMGLFLFSERLGGLQLLGLTLAVIGVAIATLA